MPIDLTGFKLDKVAQGTRVRVVDFAAPEEAAELQAVWSQRLKRLKQLYPAKSATKKPVAKKPAAKKPATKKPMVKQSTKRKATTKAKAKPARRKATPQKTRKK
jgi:hypothetical protein